MNLFLFEIYFFILETYLHYAKLKKYCMDAKDIFLFWKLQFKIIGCAVQKPGEFPSKIFNG